MKILHWYYDFLNLYGDYGNLVVLKKHLLDQGIECVIEQKTIGDKIKLSDYQFIYLSAGSERNQKVVLHDLRSCKDELQAYINAGGLMLLTGNSMELLGQKIDDEEALGLVEFSTKHTNKRFTGDVIMDSEFGKIVGFINKSSLIFSNNPYPLFKYLFKDENLQDNEFEGYHFNNVIGTEIIGPILVKNPKMMKALVQKIMACYYPDLSYQELSYEYEEDSYRVTLEALSKR